MIKIKIVPEFEALTYLVLGTIGFKHAEKLSETFFALGLVKAEFEVGK